MVASQARDSTVECKPQAQYCNNPNDAQTLEGQLNRPEHDCSYPLPWPVKNRALSSNIRHGHQFFIGVIMISLKMWDPGRSKTFKKFGAHNLKGLLKGLIQKTASSTLCLQVARLDCMNGRPAKRFDPEVTCGFFLGVAGSQTASATLRPQRSRSDRDPATPESRSDRDPATPAQSRSDCDPATLIYSHS